MRTSLVVLIAVLLVIPASAKSRRDVYPLSCDVLWTAVKNTLNHPRDYGILSVNDLSLRASFLVVGNLVQYTDRVALSEQDGGCKLDLRMLQVGSDNSDERGFRKRLKRSLVKLEAARTAMLEAAKTAPAGESAPEAVIGQH